MSAFDPLAAINDVQKPNGVKFIAGLVNRARTSRVWTFQRGRFVTYVHSIDSAELRIIVCLEFDPHAPPAEIAALKTQLINCPQTLHSVESTGSFDFLVEVAPPDLGWWNEWQKRLAEPFAKLVGRCEASFVCKRFVRTERAEEALWVPTATGQVRIECCTVDKVMADGDYVQVFSNGRKWFLHARMHALRATLGRQFVQLHRSVIVRSAFIARLTHSGRQWTAELQDGSTEQVARSHIAEVVEATRLSSRRPSSQTARRSRELPIVVEPGSDKEMMGFGVPLYLLNGRNEIVSFLSGM